MKIIIQFLFISCLFSLACSDSTSPDYPMWIENLISSAVENHFSTKHLLNKK